MGLFRKKSVQVVRRGSASEERSVRTVDGEVVTVRRFSTVESPTTKDPAKQKRQQKRQPERQPKKQQKHTDQRRRRRPASWIMASANASSVSLSPPG